MHDTDDDSFDIKRFVRGALTATMIRTGLEVGFSLADLDRLSFLAVVAGSKAPTGLAAEVTRAARLIAASGLCKDLSAFTIMVLILMPRSHARPDTTTTTKIIMVLNCTWRSWY